MKITPIVNNDFIYRYRVVNNKVVDTIMGIEYAQSSMIKANELLNRLNQIGKQNAHAIDTGKGNLLSVFA